MRSIGRNLIGILAGAALAAVLGGSTVRAETISWGTPVDGLGSGTTVGNWDLSYDATPDGVSNATDHWIQYYIPLTDDGTADSSSGTYGDGTVGLVSDTISGGCGPGTSNTCGYLDVYLRFQPIAPLPLEYAFLTVEFSDLDIDPINDPWMFFESVQFFSDESTAISDEITGLSPGSGETNGINWDVYQNLPAGLDSEDPEANNWPLYADFYGTEFTNLITDPFWMKLKFAVQDLPEWVSGSNTAEYFRARLTTESAILAPEPATFILVGSGILGLGVRARRRRRA